MKIIAIIVFIAMYVLMTLFLKKRIWIVFAAAAIFLVTGILPLSSVAGAINWNVLMMIAGTMVLVEFFIRSKMPNLIAELLMDKASTVMWLIILMSLFSGFISAFMDNVATVLMVAPVGIAICKKLFTLLREFEILLVVRVDAILRDLDVALVELLVTAKLLLTRAVIVELLAACADKFLLLL